MAAWPLRGVHNVFELHFGPGAGALVLFVLGLGAAIQPPTVLAPAAPLEAATRVQAAPSGALGALGGRQQLLRQRKCRRLVFGANLLVQLRLDQIQLDEFSILVVAVMTIINRSSC